MKILIISAKIPMPDRASGDLRFFTLLDQLRDLSDLTICAHALDQQRHEIGTKETNKYLNLLKKTNIQLGNKDVLSTLKENSFDVVIFEFYHYFTRYIDYVRLYQPNTPVIIDSVDIHYKRFFSKAKLTKNPEDQLLAEITKKAELEAYRDSDMVLCVTNDDQSELNKELRDLPTFIIPNIHKLPKPTEKMGVLNKLLFVGSFDHEPNIDAMLYFCRDIMPLVLKQAPFVSLDIIGPNPPTALLNLQNNAIKVHGRVEKLTPYYHKADIALAPLRFGAGMKGKVGEAMSYSLPIVCSSIGAEGFGVSHGNQLLIADDPDSFSLAILSFINRPEFAHKIGQTGYRFVRDNYSIDSNKVRLAKLMILINQLSPIILPFHKRLLLKLNDIYERHLGWRFTKHD